MQVKNPGQVSAGAAEAKAKLEVLRKIVSGFLLVRRHCSLYPEGHIMTITALESFHDLLSSYLAAHGELRIQVQKDRFLVRGEVVHTEEHEEGGLPFTLFRDGIKWIEFTEGVESAELRELVRIIVKYGFLSDNPDGDIVTALWETRLPHVRYKVSDFVMGSSEEAPGSVLAGPKGRHGDVREMMSSLAARRNAVPMPVKGLIMDRHVLQAPRIDPADVVCAPEEVSAVLDMVRAEEERPRGAYLDDLFDSLAQYREQDSYELILGILAEELRSSIGAARLADAARTLSRLRFVHETCRKTGAHAAAQCIEGLYHDISQPPFLAVLKEVWRRVDRGQAQDARQILDSLKPPALSTLGPMLADEQVPVLRQLLVETVVNLASNDLRPLEDLLRSRDEKLTQMLVQVIASLKGEQPMKILMSLIRHPSERVRHEALASVFKTHPGSLKDIYRLVDDPDESIRKMVLKHMSQSKESSAERFLLSYLENPRTRDKDYWHIMSCFITLGQCGSFRSIPFLRKTLLRWPWMPGFWNKAYRTGAAEALKILGTGTAQEVLGTARNSLSPSLRSIARRVG